MKTKHRNLSHAQAFKVCSVLMNEENRRVYSSMKLDAVATYVEQQVGFPVSPCSVQTLATSLGLPIGNSKARKPDPEHDNAEFNAAVVELLRAVVNVAVKNEPHREMLMKHVREVEELI